MGTPEQPQSYNPYPYVHNNAIIFFDPTGEERINLPSGENIGGKNVSSIFSMCKNIPNWAANWFEARTFDILPGTYMDIDIDECSRCSISFHPSIRVNGKQIPIPGTDISITPQIKVHGVTRIGIPW